MSKKKLYVQGIKLCNATVEEVIEHVVMNMGFEELKSVIDNLADCAQSVYDNRCRLKWEIPAKD